MSKSGEDKRYIALGMVKHNLSCLDIDIDFVEIKLVWMLRIVAAFVQKESGDKRYGLRRVESMIFIQNTASRYL